MKKKVILSSAFIISLLPMLLNQYGGRKGVQEITGLINLFHPVGLLSAALYIAGVWGLFKKRLSGKLLGAFGTIGIVASEIWNFLTWHVMTITGEVSLRNSFRFAFPEYNFGLAVSLAMVAAYFLIDAKMNLPSISGITRPQT